MADAAELLALRAALEEARFSPEREVSIGGRRVVFKTDAEMKAAIAELDAQLAGATAPSLGVTRVTYCRGT